MALLNERRLDELDRVLSPDMTSHLRIGDIKGLERSRLMMAQTCDAFPGIVWQPQEYICAPDRAVIRYCFDAVHRGAWLGVPPSHRMVHLEGIECLHIRGDRIDEATRAFAMRRRIRHRTGPGMTRSSV